MHIEDDQVWSEWEEELERRKEDEAMYVSLMERKGIKIGVEQTKRDNALRMLGKGFNIAVVAECADLPEEEVRRLAEELDS